MNAKRTYRVLHGLTGAAGQPRALSQALRSVGIEADCVLIGQSAMKYEADYLIEQTDLGHSTAANFLRNHADKYDIFHLHFRPFFYNDSRYLAFPTFMDLLALKAAGKKIVFHYRGSEVRVHSEFKLKSPYNYVDDDPYDFKEKFPENTIRRHIDFVKAVADKVLVNDAEIQSYVGDSKIINRVCSEEKLPFVGLSQRECPLIVHAPSRRAVKGTNHVLKAVETLKSEGVQFDFRLIENLPHCEAIESLKAADIIIDQLRIGWYGVLGVEAMALGKAVVCYIRDDLVGEFGQQTPVLNANPDNLVEKLKMLIKDKSLQYQYCVAGHSWFKSRHSQSKVIEELLGVYDEVIENTKHVNFNKCLEFIDYQNALINEKIGTTAKTNEWPENNYDKIIYTYKKGGMSELKKLFYSKYQKVVRK